MPELELRAEPRSVLGKKVAKLRRAGVTPANINGHHLPPQAIQIPTVELTHALRAAGATHLLRMSLSGEADPRTVLVRHVSRKPTTGQLLHIDFYQVSMTEKTIVEAPILLVGTSPAVENGDGILYQQLSTLPVECLPGDIPDHIEADISTLLEVHAALHVSDLRLPANVTTSLDPAEVVVSITATSVEAEPAVEEGEEAEAAQAEAEQQPAE